MKRLARWFGFELVRRSLRRTYRRVEWVGPNDMPPPGSPVVAYANHHVFHDGFALGYFLERVHGRRVLVWVEEFDRFPFLGLVGAMPFPRDDARARVRTIRETARRMRSDHRTALIYFPEGRLHRAEDGLSPFDPDGLQRLARVMPEAWWWPLGVHVTGWNEAHPTLVLGGGAPHRQPTGSEPGALEAVLERIASPRCSTRSTILDGHRGPNERWNFSSLKPILPKP